MSLLSRIVRETRVYCSESIYCCRSAYRFNDFSNFRLKARVMSVDGSLVKVCLKDILSSTLYFSVVLYFKRFRKSLVSCKVTKILFCDFRCYFKSIIVQNGFIVDRPDLIRYIRLW